MLVFLDANLVLFSIPKTGSTANHSILKRKADIAFSGKPTCKHMNVRKYEQFMAPYLRKNLKAQPERVAVIREPLDRLGSWFRYRQRQKTKDPSKATRGITFNEFLEAYMSDDQPAYARLGSQAKFIGSPRGEIRVDHLFAYEKSDLLAEFLEKRLGVESKAKKLNVSPKIELEVDPEIGRKLRNYLQKDFEIYEAILKAGGHLITKMNADAPA